VVIDLSLMRHVQVDPGGRIARAAGGATWETSTTPRTCSGSRRPAGSCPQPASQG
jgi:hypothetical protein